MSERRMLFSERTAYERMGRIQRLVHNALWHLTRPRPLWPVWRAYRRTWR